MGWPRRRRRRRAWERAIASRPVMYSASAATPGSVMRRTWSSGISTWCAAEAAPAAGGAGAAEREESDHQHRQAAAAAAELYAGKRHAAQAAREGRRW